MKKVDDNAKFKCKYCNEEVLAIQFDTYTLSKCYTRALRRDFVSITKPNSLKSSRDLFYCCPYCDKYCKASELRVVE